MISCASQTTTDEKKIACDGLTNINFSYVDDQEVIDIINSLYTDPISGELLNEKTIKRESLIFNMLNIKSLSDTKETSEQIEQYNNQREKAGC